MTFLLGTYPYDPVPDISKVEDDATMSGLRYLTERVGMARAPAFCERTGTVLCRCAADAAET